MERRRPHRFFAPKSMAAFASVPSVIVGVSPQGGADAVLLLRCALFNLVRVEGDKVMRCRFESGTLGGREVSWRHGYGG